jgi:chromosome segregation ATPase
MRVLQLLLALGAQASYKAFGTTNVGEAKTDTATVMLNAMQSRVDEAESNTKALAAKLAEATSAAQAATAAEKAAEARARAEEAKNEKWHEVSNALQDQVEAAKAKETAAEAKLASVAKDRDEAEAAMKAEAADVARAKAAAAQAGVHDREALKKAQDDAAKAESARAQSEKAKSALEAASQKAETEVSKLAADLKASKAASAQAMAKEQEAQAMKTQAAQELTAASAKAKAAAAEAAAQLDETRQQAQAAEKDAGHYQDLADKRAAALAKLQANANSTLAENAQVKKQLSTELKDLERAQDSLDKKSSEAAEAKEELGHYKDFLGRDEKELKQRRAEVDKVTTELDTARVAYQKELTVAANATAKTTAAKAAAEEAVAAAKDSHRTLMERLKEIADLQDNVDTLQKRVKNLTKESRDGVLKTKWTQMKDAAAMKTLESTVAKLKQDVKTEKTKEVDAEHRATEAAKARVAAEDHAGAEAEVAARSQRIADAARADEQDTNDQLKSSQKSAKHEHERAQNLTQRVDELREALDFHVRSENAVADARDQLNSSLSKAQQQVSLLQRRGLELEDVGAREAASRRETQGEAEKLEVEMVEAKKQIEELQKKVSTKDAELSKVTERYKSAESSENEYFDGMTSLQSAKDDLTSQLADAQKSAVDAKHKADELEKTNEYLRGEKASTDSANQAAMSDYLREIEDMKQEETRKDGSIATGLAKIKQLSSAVSDLWKELTPSQRKDLKAKAQAQAKANSWKDLTARAPPAATRAAGPALRHLKR